MAVTRADPDNTFNIILINMEKLATSINADQNSGGPKLQNWGGVKGVKYEFDPTMWFR